ncbi:MAG: hypothetical protein KIT69_12090 [Propionibacteriaceae bacterium]|nr:hypothetical protein [Propionibacteriaceae bacterium]
MNPVLDKIYGIFKVIPTENPTKKHNHYGSELIAVPEFNNQFIEVIKYMKSGSYILSEKIDGTCRLVYDNKMWKRRDIKLIHKGKNKGQMRETPEGWKRFSQLEYRETEMTHNIGFMPIKAAEKEDIHDLEAHSEILSPNGNKISCILVKNKEGNYEYISLNDPEIQGKTFELVGCKICNNPYKYPIFTTINSIENSIRHCYIQHGSQDLSKKIIINNETDWDDVTIIFNKIKEFLLNNPEVEGIVIHIQDDKQSCFKFHRLYLGY